VRKIVFLISAVACVSAPALANHDKKPADPNKKVCRRIVETGSIMGESVCHTSAEWAQIDAQNNRNASDMLSQHPANAPENH
jgi:hypothetical protein